MPGPGGQAGNDAPAVRRVNVHFSEPVYRMLDSLAKKRGTTMAEILRDAIALERWLDEQQEAGARFLVERDGSIREVLFR